MMHETWRCNETRPRRWCYAAGVRKWWIYLLAAMPATSMASCDTATCDGAACGEPVALTPHEQRCPESGVLHGPWSLRFDETSVTVRWDSCAPGSTEVTFEREGGGDEGSSEGTQTPYEVTTAFESLDGVEPDLPGTYYLGEARITGLKPSVCYTYQLAADASRGGRFCTAKASGDDFSFMAIGDTNPAIGDTSGVLDAALSRDVDFSIHLGDVQYYASIFESWATWFPSMAPLLENGAFMPSVGNHEYENDTEFQDYYARLFGGAGFTGNGVEWYRFQSGGVWFFSLSTENDLSAGSEQAKWLQAQMADAASQPGYRFGVVYFHRPMLTISEDAQKSDERTFFTPMFQQYGIKLVMNGHVHGYERFITDDITYVVSGGGGAVLSDLDVNLTERPQEAALRQAVAKAYHATVISVSQTAITGEAISNTGEMLDSFTIPLDP